MRTSSLPFRSPCLAAALAVLCASSAVAAGPPAIPALSTVAGHAGMERIAPWRSRFGRSRPVIAIIGNNSGTELVDFAIPYGVLVASGAADVITAVRQLTMIASDDLIAGLLNRNGLKTGNGNRWTRERVTSMRSNYRIPVFKPAEDGIEPWLNLTNAAKRLQPAIAEGQGILPLAIDQESGIRVSHADVSPGLFPPCGWVDLRPRL